MDYNLIKQKMKERDKLRKKADWRNALVLFSFIGFYFVLFIFLRGFNANEIFQWLITAILVGLFHHIINYEIYSRLHQKELDDEERCKEIEEEIERSTR